MATNVEETSEAKHPLDWTHVLLHLLRFADELHKIGFELLCLNRGAEFVLDEKFDQLRSYILRGQGSRDMVLTTSAKAGSSELPSFQLRHDPGWPGWLAVIRLAATLYVDLRPGNEYFAKANLAELEANNMVKWSDKDGGKPVRATSQHTGSRLGATPARSDGHVDDLA